MRILLLAALVVSWLVMLPLLWRAFATVPSPERLRQSHMIEIPTLRTVVQQAGIAFGELLVLSALLWPWWLRAWLPRLWAAALGTTAWFLTTTPLGLTKVQWVHRRWLAAVALALLLSAVVASGRAVLPSRQVKEGPRH